MAANRENNPNECGVQVFCRIRPLNKTELANNYQFLPKFQGTDTISLAGKVYVFDRVFQPNTTQEDLYRGAAYHIVQDVLNGYNGTIFAYGQTSSGKTHTMEGVFADPNLEGVIPRIVRDIFEHIYGMDAALSFQLKVSYFEIYNEKIRDLLDVTKTNLSIHEDKNRVPYVKGATERFVANFDEVMMSIEDGKNNRQVAVTNMNEHSSRSHSVFTITVEQTHTETQKKLTGKLYLVDLAGSEKVSKTGAEGAVLEEAKNINKSLSALGIVISALAEGTKSHVPYRDSKLTRILQESLGGNSRTTVIICASPASYNEAETRSTMLFGQRAKSIKNVVVANEEVSAEEWKRRYEKEKAKSTSLRTQLAAALAELQRWRAGERVPEADWVQITEAALAGVVGDTTSPSTTDSMSASMFQSIAPAQPMLTSNTGPITDEDKKKYEAERTQLYQQLDEKDDEIQSISTQLAKMKDELADIEDQLTISKGETAAVNSELTSKGAQLETLNEEHKSVLTVIDELVMNVETKTGEASKFQMENDTLQEELLKLANELSELQSQLSQSQETNSTHKKRLMEGLNVMIKDLSELEHTRPFEAGEKTSEEEMLAHLRICVSKLSSDYKTAKQKVGDLESGSDGWTKKLSETEKELSECRLQLQQNEAKSKSLQESLDKQEKAKRELEAAIDELRARVAAGGGAEAADESHSKQLAQLRDELSDKSKQLEELNASMQALAVGKEQLASELDKLRLEEANKDKLIKDLAAKGSMADQAASDMRSLSETVDKELATMHALKKQFLTTVVAKLSRNGAAGAEATEEDFTSSTAQRQKIQFLENNLEQLTKVHKQLVRDNADLRTELPKMESRLKACNERIKKLEQALRDTKETCMRDRKRYQSEVERIKEAVRQRNMARKGVPQIVKPIRPGQPSGGTPVIRPANATINNLPTA